MQRVKPGDRIKSNTMLCLADNILWSRDIDNNDYKSLLPRLDAFEMWIISQNIENSMDGKYYQRGSIEKDRNRQRNSETIQYEEITISRTYYKA